MRHWLQWTGIAVIVLLIAIQLIPVKRTNPAVDPAMTVYAAGAMPATVRDVFENSCSNCHSNETSWPWYSHVAPLSWVVVHDVNRGRHELNFSEWGTYPADKRELKLGEICDQVTNGDMPDHKYVLLHRKAALSKDQRDAICAWVENAR